MIEKGEAGHRQRLREKFLAGEEGSRSDETLLELLLTFAIDRKDVKPLAQELIRVFGSLTGVLAATPDKLLAVKGLGQTSVTLLQAVGFLRSGVVSQEKRIATRKESGSIQHKMFKDAIEVMAPKIEPASQNGMPDQPIHATSADKPKNKEPIVLTETLSEARYHNINIQTRPSKETPNMDRINRRKFQVSNGYQLEFDQLARVLHFLEEHIDARKIDRKVLQEDSGLAERQIENLVSMGSAMGLIKPSSQVLTPVGLLVAEHDIFIEKQGTLEWCHYKGAGSYRNLVWFEIFNNLLTEPSPMTQNEWLERLRSELSGKFTPKTLGTGLREEVRFVVDAYIERNFNKLNLLQQLPGERIYRRRYTNFLPLVLTAMIYDFCAVHGERLSQVAEMAATPGSPAVIFGLDVSSFRQQIEGLHERGWIRYETTHNLDQIRLKPSFSSLEFLSAHFEDRDPRKVPNPLMRGVSE